MSVTTRSLLLRDRTPNVAWGGRAGGSICRNEGRPVGGVVRLFVVVELEGRLRLEGDEEGEGEAARRGLGEGQDQVPVVQVALQRDDLAREVVRAKVVGRLPLRGP